MKYKESKKTVEFIQRIRDLEKDHKPDCCPSITMEELSEIANRMEQLEKINWIHCRDWADTHTHVEEIVTKYIPKDKLLGKGEEFKDIDELVDLLIKFIPEDKLLNGEK